MLAPPPRWGSLSRRASPTMADVLGLPAEVGRLISDGWRVQERPATTTATATATTTLHRSGEEGSFALENGLRPGARWLRCACRGIAGGRERAARGVVSWRDEQAGQGDGFGLGPGHSAVRCGRGPCTRGCPTDGGDTQRSTSAGTSGSAGTSANASPSGGARPDAADTAGLLSRALCGSVAGLRLSAACGLRTSPRLLLSPATTWILPAPGHGSAAGLSHP